MKKRWLFWWLVNIVWGLLFMLGTAVVWLRKVDGAGVAQTPELKLLAFIILRAGIPLPQGTRRA